MEDETHGGDDEGEVMNMTRKEEIDCEEERTRSHLLQNVVPQIVPQVSLKIINS
jgi:hypothetical protein